MISGPIKINLNSKLAKIELPILPVHLSQIIGNIISNAIEAVLESKQKDGEITVSIDDANPIQTVFTIEDNGIGIAEDKIDEIFKPNFSTKDKVGALGGGDGIGLSSVTGLLKMYNGTISVESTVGEGTRFYIAIPRKPANPNHEENQKDPPYDQNVA